MTTSYIKPQSLKNLPSVRQLRAFLAIYYTGTLSGAAEALSLTQPAVTILLRELEQKLAVRLFDRTTRSLRKTPAATEAIAFAEQALAQLEAMTNSMHDLAAARRGSIRIAATSTVAQTLLPRAIRRYLEAHPGIRINVDDCAPGEFADRIMSEQVDFGVGTLEATVTGLNERIFIDDHLCAVAPDGTLPNKKSLTWNELAALPAVLVKPGYGVRRHVDRAVYEAGVELQIAYEVSLLTTALAMAANHLGIAVLPQSILAHTEYRDLVALRLIRPTVQRHTSVVFKEGRTLSPAARAFTETLDSAFSSRQRRRGPARG